MIIFNKKSGKRVEEMVVGRAYKTGEHRIFIPCYHDTENCKVRGFDVFKNGKLEHNGYFYGFSATYEELEIKNIDLVLDIVG